VQKLTNKTWVRQICCGAQQGLRTTFTAKSTRVWEVALGGIIPLLAGFSLAHSEPAFCDSPHPVITGQRVLRNHVNFDSKSVGVNGEACRVIHLAVSRDGADIVKVKVYQETPGTGLGLLHEIPPPVKGRNDRKAQGKTSVGQRLLANHVVLHVHETIASVSLVNTLRLKHRADKK
jgi:hypothetical protein